MTKKIIILAIAIVVGNVAVSAQKTKELTILIPTTPIAVSIR